MASWSRLVPALLIVASSAALADGERPGTTCHDPRLVASASGFTGGGVLAWAGDGYGVVWEDAGIRFLRLDATGEPTSPVLSLSSGGSMQRRGSWTCQSMAPAHKRPGHHCGVLCVPALWGAAQ